MKTREEHLQWAKDRAMEYIREGDLINAVGSMGSDLWEHPELKNIDGIALGMELLISREFNKKELITKWIQGFH